MFFFVVVPFHTLPSSPLWSCSGDIYRSQRKALQFRRKKMATNPTRGGPWHHRSPSAQFFRTVRGMLPHKMPRGKQALANLKVFEGCPAPYDTQKKMVVPQALRALRLAPGHRWCVLGEVQARVGWNYAPVVARLEAKRKTAAFAWHLKHRKEVTGKAAALQKAAGDAKVKPFSALLTAYGH